MAVAVSVVLPTFNRRRFLQEAVASVFAQTFCDWELLVIDDGSTDGSDGDIAAIGDPRVRLIRLPHCGRPARVKNVGLAHAGGHYVAFLDSDDLWEPAKLERQLDALRAHPAARWSYTDVTRVDATGARLPDHGIQPWRNWSGSILRELLAMEALVATPTVVAERSLLAEARDFDESLDYVQDTDLWFRIGAIAGAVAISERLARVRVHDGARTVDRLAVHRCWVRVYEKAAAATRDPGLKAICRRRSTLHRLAAATLAADRGRTAEALRGFTAAALHDPLSPRVWRALAGRVIPRALRDR